MAVVNVTDNFSRAATTSGLGVTSTGTKPWVSLGIGQARLDGQGNAVLDGGEVQVVDAETPDLDIGATGGLWPEYGIAFRVVDKSNMWRLLRYVDPADGIHYVRLTRTHNGVNNHVWRQALSPDSLGQMRVVTRDTGELSVYAPGQLVAGYTTTNIALASATKAGIAAVGQGGFRTSKVDHFTFVVGNLPPKAPTNLVPNGSANVDVSQPVTFSWTHSDTDAQSRYDLSYRKVGTTTWTVVSQNTSTQSRTFAAGTLSVGDYEWEVRTYDTKNQASPSSTRVFFTAVAPPGTPTVLSPTSLVTTASHTSRWAADAQEAYQLRILLDDGGLPGATLFDSGTVLEPGTRSRVTPHPVNNRTEHLQVRVRNAGLWSGWGSVRYSVAFTAPVLPTGRLDVGGPWMRVLITNASSTDPAVPVVAHNSVYRRPKGSADTVGIRVGKNVVPSAKWPDTTVSHLEDVEYRIVAHGVNGGDSSSGWFDTVDVIVSAGGVFADEDFFMDEFSDTDTTVIPPGGGGGGGGGTTPEGGLDTWPETYPESY